MELWQATLTASGDTEIAGHTGKRVVVKSFYISAGSVPSNIQLYSDGEGESDTLFKMRTDSSGHNNHSVNFQEGEYCLQPDAKLFMNVDEDNIVHVTVLGYEV